MAIEHAKSCNDTRTQNCSVTELTFLKPKHKDVLEANGPKPKPELNPEALERKVDKGGNARFQQALTLAIESATCKPPEYKKSPLQELNAQESSKMASFIFASVENFGLNCNAPDAAPRNYSGIPLEPSMPTSGANAFGAYGVKGNSGDTEKYPTALYVLAASRASAKAQTWRRTLATSRAHFAQDPCLCSEQAFRPR